MASPVRNSGVRDNDTHRFETDVDSIGCTGEYVLVIDAARQCQLGVHQFRVRAGYAAAVHYSGLSVQGLPQAPGDGDALVALGPAGDACRRGEPASR